MIHHQNQVSISYLYTKELLIKLCICFSTIAILSYTSQLFGQQGNSKYFENTRVADSVFLKKNFSEAVKLYMSAFEKNGGSGQVVHRYRAATCWVLLGNADSAFSQLNRIASKGKFGDVYLLTQDANLFELHKDARWGPLVERVKKNFDEKSGN